MRTGILDVQGQLYYGGWQLISDVLLASAATSYTFSNLDGNTDEEYMIVAQIINGYNGALGYSLTINNDTGANYGTQYLSGINTTAAAARNTSASSISFGNGDALGDFNLTKTIIYAKSGYVRTLLTKFTWGATTTIGGVQFWGGSWNNTADNITRLDIIASQANGLGIGTHLFLFKRTLTGLEASSGLKVGDLDVRGQLKAGIFQLVERYEVAENIGTDNYDKLIASFDGTDGATTYTAETGQTVTFVNNAQLDTAQKKFGTASLLLDGDDYVTLPDNDTWNFGSGNFTIDFQVRYNSVAANYFFIQKNGAELWTIYYTGSNIYFQVYNSSDVQLAGYHFAWTPSTNTWYHIAVVRSGTNIYIFIDGVSQTLTVDTAIGSTAIPDVASLLYIGASSTGTTGLNGWLDGVRISKGIARWTSNFTPPTVAYGITSKTFSGLTGNTDLLYIVKARVIAGNGAADCFVRPNNVSTADNYGYQYIYGADTTVAAAKGTTTGLWKIGASGATSDISLGEMLIYSKSGYVRTALIDVTNSIATTTVGQISIWGESWNNTADEITSLVVGSTAANGLGVGTVLELYALRKHS